MVSFLAPQRRERAVDPTLTREEKSADGQQQRLAGKNVPATVLLQRRPGLQKTCEGIRGIRGLQFFRPLNLFQRTVNSRSGL